MVILRLIQDQKVKTFDIFHAVTGMLSVIAHYKLSLSGSYNCTQNYDKFCISEIYLGSSFDENNYFPTRWL